ncbi:MAG: FecR domain-containing protein [Planctomycetes bacterium]|nr:FecR domain-containing protein [Planctomycetota bacterium]
MKDAETYQELILRYLDGNLLPEDEDRVTELLRSNPDARTFLREVAEHAVTVADVERVERRRQGELGARRDWAGNRREVLGKSGIPRSRSTRWPWAVAAAASVALIAGLFFLGSDGEPEIARLTESSGPLRWTGNGGRVTHGIEAGSWLGGGTIESLSTDSWGTLEFRDGSRVTVSGQSMLTISEHDQKELFLREGIMSASVSAQPHGRPMLVHTPTARLEVLGTQLDVDAGQTSTVLRVNDGIVRATQLSDGSVTEVPAGHQVVASIDRRAELKITRSPGPVVRWQCNLPTDRLYGDWLSVLDTGVGGLRTAPMLWGDPKEPITLHIVSLSVSRNRPTPVLLTSGTRLRIRGRIESPGKVYFGLTTRHVKGGFAGKFLVERNFEDVQEGGKLLDIELNLEDFRPQEEELTEKQPELFPASPVGLELFDWWCCTVNEDAGLIITHVELDANLIEPAIPLDYGQL